MLSDKDMLDSLISMERVLARLSERQIVDYAVCDPLERTRDRLYDAVYDRMKPPSKRKKK